MLGQSPAAPQIQHDLRRLTQSGSDTPRHLGAFDQGMAQAQIAQGGQAIRITSGSGDGMAGRVGQLDRRHAHGRGRNPNQYSLARVKFAFFPQGAESRQKGLGNRGCFSVSQPVRNRECFALRNGHEISTCAGRHDAHHPIAGSAQRAACARILHHAGVFQADPARIPSGRWRIEPAALQQIGAIDACGMHPDPDLFGADVRKIHFGPFQNLRAAGMIGDQGPHARHAGVTWPRRGRS